MKLSVKERTAAAMYAAGADYKQIGTVLKYVNPYSGASNLITNIRYKLNQAPLNNEEFRGWLARNGWPQCPYCGEPVRMEDKFVTPIHTTGKAEGSFLCHFEGNPECDCWACQNERECS